MTPKDTLKWRTTFNICKPEPKLPTKEVLLVMVLTDLIKTKLRDSNRTETMKKHSQIK